MSLINKEILPFTAQAFDPKINLKDTRRFKRFLGVVCFYPADFSFVCPTELEDLQNQYEELQKGVNVFSVSTDTHFVHKAWHDHSDAISKITYTMIGDPSQTITRNFDR